METNLRRGFQEATDRPRRFYTTVSVVEADGGFAVLLDDRQVRGPLGGRLLVPTRALAEMIAAEWARQGETLDIVGMHATRLANTAIDSIPQARAATAQSVADYAGSDLLCYFAEDPHTLVARQSAAWEPVLTRAEQEFGVAFVRLRADDRWGRAHPEHHAKREVHDRTLREHGQPTIRWGGPRDTHN